jgi:hypothetical protein
MMHMNALRPGFGLFLLFASLVHAQDSTLRRRDFNTDPNWEGLQNRLVPNPALITRQDFVWRDSNRAGGKAKGEIGGWIQRSATPAYYATEIPAKTLNDKLTASGRFAVTKDDSNSGVLFGWFNRDSRGWRTPNSLTFRLDGNGGKYWVFFEYGTQHWLAGGMGCFKGERYQTTESKPFRADGTPHTWEIAYDPAGAGGRGQIRFTLDGTTYTLDLAEGHKADGATFNRFGMFNQQISGSGMEAWFDDVHLDGKPIDFASDPKWEARGNQTQFEDRVIRPYHDFGFSNTNRAGGARGEIGGVIWRNEAPAYYGDRIGPVTLNDKLHVAGTMAFTGAGSDSGVFVGFFNAESKKRKTKPMHEEPEKNMLAIMIEGQSRIGHYFRPAYYTKSGRGKLKESGPIIRPDGKVHRWSMDYDPAGAGGNGQIIVKFDDSVQTFDLSPGDKADGATFDRFGIFDLQSGGHYVEVWFDDLVYTAGPQAK